MKAGVKNFVMGRLAFLLLISLIFFHCKKESALKESDPVSVTPPVPAVKTTDVYAGGFETDAAGYQIAKVWKNGVPTSLTHDGDNAWVSSVAVSGNDVYAAGILFPGGTYTTRIAKLWKNGVDIPILASGEMVYGYAYSVFASGSDVYVAGVVDSVNHTSTYAATLWKNGVAITLSTTFGDALAVFVSGNDVYVAGDEYSSASLVWEPKYWKNGVSHVLPITNPSVNNHVASIFVSGTDVYLGGDIESTNPNSFATLWKNDVPTNFTDGTGSAGIVGVSVSGNDVYAGGSYTPAGAVYPILKLWKNGVATDFSSGTHLASCEAMYVSDKDVYFSGHEWQDTILLNWQAVIWKNGTPSYLTDGVYQAVAYSIFVNSY